MTASTKPVYILGTGLSHDGSACLLRDGRVLFAIEKERLTRRKHDGFNDSVAIQYCLDAAGITISDLTLIVQNANFGMFEWGNRWFEGERLVQDGMPVITISHHLAHAYSAFGTSPFEEAAVLVIDGCGNGFDECVDLEGAKIPEKPPRELAHLYFEKDSFYLFGAQGRRSIYKDFSPWGLSFKRYPLHPPTTRHSIGGLYHGVSKYVFGGMDDSGKLMGLAPYGKPGVYDFEIFDLRDGRVFVHYDWMKSFKHPVRRPEGFKANFQKYADLALHVQREVERALLYLVRCRYNESPHRNLCYSGGVALNAVANFRIRSECPFEDLFVQPAAGDNGLALGAAYYGWLEVLKKEKIPHDRSTRFGKIYSIPAIESALSPYESELRVRRVGSIAEETAAALAMGKVVGWFQGRSEFGPRALGGRSIVADPRSAAVRDYINAKIKLREDFRPFAPSVPIEDANIYFECPFPSPYMLFVTTVRPEWAKVIPSVVHADQSARIQTVCADDDPLYHRLLRAFKARTGLSVLLNTSFNKRGMPIVETPDHAIRFFLQSALDVLAIEDYLIEKQQVTDSDPAMSTHFQRFRIVLERNRSSALQIGLKYEFNIEEEHQPWTVNLRPGGPNVERGRISDADVIVECRQKDLDELFDSVANMSPLLREGRLRLSGHTESVEQLSRLLGLLGVP